MTGFNWYVDGLIVLIYLLATISVGIFIRRYVNSVDDYLVADRKVDLYLGIASLAATEFGIVTFMANAELGYKYGFAGITPGVALMVAMFGVGYTGFCIKPLREAKVITLPEFFEKKFGKNVRWACGVVIVLGGLLNMGVFLRMGGDFLTLVLGIDPGYLEVMMTILLVLVAAYTILGGMLSVLVTDYIQFVVMSLGLISVSFLFLYKFGWNDITENLMTAYGERAFNPFVGEQYGWDRIGLDIFVAIASILTWQTMIMRVLSAKSARIGQKIYMGTSPFFMVRFAVPVLFGVVALYYFNINGGASEQDILSTPLLIASAVPVGLLGLLIAAMLAADMSTNSSYLLAWSSVIYNDILAPIHKGKWSEKKGLRINRILVGCLGIFLLLYGLWYPLKNDLWVYLQITGTIYLASMSVILIAGCYWNNANNWGAIGAIIIGSLLPVSFLVLQQLPSTLELTENLGPYKLGIATYLFTGLAMILGSVLKNKLILNKN